MNNKIKEILRIGLPWALGMFLILTIIFPLMREEVITTKKVVIAIPLWIIGGLLFGYMMVRWGVKKK